MYEVLALEQAFPGGIDSGVLNRILHEGPTPLQTKVPDIDPELTGDRRCRTAARRAAALPACRRHAARHRAHTAAAAQRRRADSDPGARNSPRSTLRALPR